MRDKRTPTDVCGEATVPHFCVQHVEKETNVGQLKGEGSPKKDETTKGQLLLPEGNKKKDKNNQTKTN